jgi:hypothetical protein
MFSPAPITSTPTAQQRLRGGCSPQLCVLLLLPLLQLLLLLLLLLGLHQPAPVASTPTAE